MRMGARTRKYEKMSNEDKEKSRRYEDTINSCIESYGNEPKIGMGRKDEEWIEELESKGMTEERRVGGNEMKSIGFERKRRRYRRRTEPMKRRGVGRKKKVPKEDIDKMNNNEVKVEQDCSNNKNEIENVYEMEEMKEKCEMWVKTGEKSEKLMVQEFDVSKTKIGTQQSGTKGVKGRRRNKRRRKTRISDYRKKPKLEVSIGMECEKDPGTPLRLSNGINGLHDGKGTENCTGLTENKPDCSNNQMVSEESTVKEELDDGKIDEKVNTARKDDDKEKPKEICNEESERAITDIGKSCKDISIENFSGKELMDGTSGSAVTRGNEDKKDASDMIVDVESEGKLPSHQSSRTPFKSRIFKQQKIRKIAGRQKTSWDLEMRKWKLPGSSRSSARIFLRNQSKLNSAPIQGDALTKQQLKRPLRTVELIKRPLELRDPGTKLLFMATLGLYPAAKEKDSQPTPIVVLMEKSEVLARDLNVEGSEFDSDNGPLTNSPSISAPKVHVKETFAKRTVRRYSILDGDKKGSVKSKEESPRSCSEKSPTNRAVTSCSRESTLDHLTHTPSPPGASVIRAVIENGNMTDSMVPMDLSMKNTRCSEAMTSTSLMPYGARFEKSTRGLEERMPKPNQLKLEYASFPLDKQRSPTPEMFPYPSNGLDKKILTPANTVLFSDSKPEASRRKCRKSAPKRRNKVSNGVPIHLTPSSSQGANAFSMLEQNLTQLLLAKAVSSSLITSR